MMGQNTNELPGNEISDLIRIGNELYELLEENTTVSEHDYQKKEIHSSQIIANGIHAPYLL
ncbi:MAG: hypothetical protein R2741_00570 [Methanolobus sp.]